MKLTLEVKTLRMSSCLDRLLTLLPLELHEDLIELNVLEAKEQILKYSDSLQEQVRRDLRFALCTLAR